ncbi:transposase [bacterium]|nr:MAG: transposase [bacterium]
MNVLQFSVMWSERRSVRIQEYDYRQNGAYAITICVRERRCAFARITAGVVHLHPFGQLALERWLAIPAHHPNVKLDEFVIMPNHMHGILWIENEAPPNIEQEVELRQFGKPLSGSVSTVIGSYKGSVSREIGKIRGIRTKAWQRGFHDHIIRSDADLLHQRQYIQQNPAKWADDEFFMAA